MCVCVQLCPTLCDPMDCTLPGSFVHGIFQARMLERAAISYSSGSSLSSHYISCALYIGCLAFFFFFLFTTAPPGNSMEFIILDFKIALESVTNFLLLFLTLEYKCHNCYLCLSYHYILAEDNFLSYLTGSQMERNLALDWII